MLHDLQGGKNIGSGNENSGKCSSPVMTRHLISHCLNIDISSTIPPSVNHLPKWLISASDNQTVKNDLSFLANDRESLKANKKREKPLLKNFNSKNY